MKGPNIRLDELFHKYLENDISEHELFEFSGYVEDPMFSEELHELLGSAFQNGNEVLSIGDFGRSRVLNKILGADTSGGKAKRISLWIRIGGVAAAVAFIMFGIFFFRSQTQPDIESNFANDVKPGTLGATLTLSNGKKIKLTQMADGKLAEEAGIVVTKTADGQLVYEATDTPIDPNKINTLSTARGETYILTLPDKSKVWLNAASSLTYLASLNERGKRVVKLSGEAYFEISKDKEHPFIVETDKQRVEVLGTHFNVRAYGDEETLRTTLIEGKVKISVDENSEILMPGFEAINTQGRIRIEKADSNWAVAWKNNKFIFDNQQIEDIMPMIARWYNVEVIYTSEIPADTFFGTVSRDNNISKVLSALESVGKVHFKIDGRKVFVSK